MFIRTPEQIRSDNEKKKRLEELELELSLTRESLDNEMAQIRYELDYVANQLSNAKEIRDEMFSSNITTESVGSVVMKYNSYMNTIKQNLKENTDKDVKEFFNSNISSVSMENYEFGMFSKLHIAREGIVQWIKMLIRKLKEYISYAYNKFKTYISKLSRNFDKVEEKSKELASKFNSSSLPLTFTDHQSDVFVTWLENSFPLMLYINTDIGYDKQEGRAPDKLVSFLKKSSDSLQYPKLADLEIRTISDYNNNFKNFYENRSIQDSNGAFARDSFVQEAIKKSSFKLKGGTIIKPYTSDGKSIYALDIGEDGDKVIKTNFVKVPFTSLTVEKPSKTRGSALLRNNIPNSCGMLCRFVSDNIGPVMKSITEIPGKLFKEKEALYKELETFDDNENGDASKCISAYVKFMNQLYTNYLFGEVYATYDAMYNTYNMCNKAYLLITSKENN